MIELRPHFAQAQDPETKVGLFDENGKPIPLFPDQRTIWADGQFVGYVCSAPWHRISFTDYYAGADPRVREGVRQLVIREFGVDPDTITNVNEPPPPEVDEDSYEDAN